MADVYDASPKTTIRKKLRLDEKACFVDRAHFCKLIVSARILNRCDVPAACVRGIYDPEQDVRYLIEEEQLFQPIGL